MYGYITVILCQQNNVVKIHKHISTKFSVVLSSSGSWIKKFSAALSFPLNAVCGVPLRLGVSRVFVSTLHNIFSSAFFVSTLYGVYNFAVSVSTLHSISSSAVFVSTLHSVSISMVFVSFLRNFNMSSRGLLGIPSLLSSSANFLTSKHCAQ